MAKNLIITLLLVLVTLSPSNAHSHSHSHSHSHAFLENLEGVEKGMSMKGVDQLKQYLRKYGYLEYDENVANKDEFDDAVEFAVKRYQEFFSLKPSGKLDSETIIQMAKPRCGFPDIVTGSAMPQYAFFPGTPKWPPSKMHLNYNFNSSVQVVGVAILSPLMALAFGKWADVTTFTFGQVSNDSPKDISIGFHKRDHGYTGPVGTLAFSFPPPIGISQFDADVNWCSTDYPNDKQYDLESLAVHEIGHLLGLGHSSLKEAVMYPNFYLGATRRELNADDIQGIHNLYGLPPAAKNNKIE